jgi:antitoxin CptB
MNNDIENLKKRLIYRSQYRGTKEMDKLIGSFVQIYINRLDANELKELENFLNIDDNILYKFYNEQVKDISLVETSILKLFKEFEYND